MSGAKRKTFWVAGGQFTISFKIKKPGVLPLKLYELMNYGENFRFIDLNRAFHKFSPQL